MASTHTINGISGPLTFNYTWWLYGGLQSEHYPSGRVVNYAIDDAGRMNKVYTSGKTYADLTAFGNDSFTSDGRIRVMELGNSLWATYDYHPPGTPTKYQLGTAYQSGDKLQLEYYFNATANNGNLESQVITRPGGVFWQQNYFYDGVNRLQMRMKRRAEGRRLGRGYGYDQWGNRWVASSYGIAHTDPREPNEQADINPANNRLVGVSYDVSGNQTSYDPYTLEYDGESRIKTMKIGANVVGSFVYDGDGRRVKKEWASGARITISMMHWDNWQRSTQQRRRRVSEHRIHSRTCWAVCVR